MLGFKNSSHCLVLGYCIVKLTNPLGLSPHQYVLQNRVERAKKLITVCDSNLTDIALQVGFYDQTHFGKAFKRTVGVSPKVFAKLRAT
ncbi:MAG: helix-turn-helix transcriptional regulator [Nostoc indistinguendum CM1-VF10]|nr:helix-turn-helix transcriptional regulator [Nostoc indistinguendum CM1-VF10]